MFLENTPNETFADIGGLDEQIGRIREAIELHYYHAGRVAKYGNRRVGSILLYGPPGTGKTMMARAMANWLATLSSSGRSRFMHIKPSALNSYWFSQSERNMREAFRVARAAGLEEPEVPVVMFFDEIDSLAAGRGQNLMRAHDNVLNAFMVELDGMEARGNILVVTATNRKDILDSGAARPERLGDLQIAVPRPSRSGARQIFERHLPDTIPFHRNGHADPAEARQEVIDTAVSRIYAPNGDSELLELHFRDGKRQIVTMGELLSGASIAKIARVARERACLREARGGEEGVRVEDAVAALLEEADCLAGSVSAANARNVLPDLPTDVEVVRVERLRRNRQRRRSYHYMNVA